MRFASGLTVLICVALAGVGSCAAGQSAVSNPGRVVSEPTRSSQASSPVDVVVSSEAASHSSLSSMVSGPNPSLICPSEVEVAVAGGGDETQLVPTKPDEPFEAVVCVYPGSSGPVSRVLSSQQIKDLVTLLNSERHVNGAYSCGAVGASERIYMQFIYSKRRAVAVTFDQLGCSLLTNGPYRAQTDPASQKKIESFVRS